MASCRTPYFSIVIPTYQRPEHLPKLLSSLTNLNYPNSRFEVIVVDDGGGASLEPIISRFNERMNLTLLRQDNAGPAAARNKGAVHAEGTYLAFTDDDCVTDRNWLQSLAESFVRKPVCICGGKTVNALKDNVYSTASQMLIDYLYANYNPAKQFGAFFPTNNFAVNKENFLEIGGFDSTLRFGEDRDFCYRWASHGNHFVFNSDAIVFHFHELNFFSYIQQHFSYGGGTFQFWRRSNHNGIKPPKLNLPTWYINLMLYGLRREKNLKGLLYTLLLATMQASNTIGMLWEALKDYGK